MMALLSVEDALAQVLDGVEVLEAETVPLRLAHHRVLAEAVAALRTQPPFAASAMDGYAVRSDDLAIERQLRLIGESAAGLGFSGQLGNGECVRIFTGAPIPAGADTIVIQEHVRVDGASIIPTCAISVRPDWISNRAICCLPLGNGCPPPRSHWPPPWGTRTCVSPANRVWGFWRRVMNWCNRVTSAVPTRSLPPTISRLPPWLKPLVALRWI
jgi:hypothetical protein